jgi:hypothetical protein
MNILPKIPKGVLIVFASRSLLDQFLFYWKGDLYNSYYYKNLIVKKKSLLNLFQTRKLK